MRGIFILNCLIIIIHPLTTSQHYISNITEILEGMHQYQQQRIIKFYKNYVYHRIDYYEGVPQCQ